MGFLKKVGKGLKLAYRFISSPTGSFLVSKFLPPHIAKILRILIQVAKDLELNPTLTNGQRSTYLSLQAEKLLRESTGSFPKKRLVEYLTASALLASKDEIQTDINP